MASSTLCVSCAQLPQKDATVAVSKQRCPDCESVIGVTSYGSAFRVKAAKKILFMSPLIFTGVTIAAGLFMFAMIIAGLAIWSKEQVVGTPRPPEPLPSVQFARVKEVAITDPMPRNLSPHESKQRLQTLIRQIKDENNVERDRFLVNQIKHRPELRGLPFVMGDACRMDQEKSRTFQNTVEAVRTSFDADQPRFGGAKQDLEHSGFWGMYTARSSGDSMSTAGIAALSQMLAPERMSLRATYVQRLGSSQRQEAIVALARSAVFDPDGDVRNLAIKGLKGQDRFQQETGEILMRGVRYPMTSVSRNAAQAIVMLDRKDLLTALAAFMDDPAPGDPEPQKVDGQDVCVVREVVRINHHRNCLLCHPPAQSGQPQEVPGVMPIPGSPFPQSPSEAYGAAQSTGDPMVRADTTYLRQDFSMMLPVENAHPWPEKQRFDFLVRERVVEGKELDDLRKIAESRQGLSENHQSVLLALRRLTGQDAAPNRAAWERVIGGQKAE